MQQQFEVSVEPGDGRTVVWVRGEIDLQTSAESRRRLDELVGTVVVDLSQCTFLDSSGMAALVSARNRLQEGSGTLWIREPNAFIRRSLEITGLQRLFLAESCRAAPPC